MSGLAGSINERTAQALLVETQRLGRTASLDDVHGAYQTLFGDVERNRISHALAVLMERGEARKHGRLRRLHYEHNDHPVPHEDSEDPVPPILEIVRSHCAGSGEAISASTVRRKLLEQGFVLTGDQVRTRLETLARDTPRKRTRTPGEWDGAELERVVLETPGGQRKVFWRPTGTSYDPPTNPSVSRSQREAIRLVSEALGRPAARSEVLKWARTVGAGGPAEPHAAAVLGKRSSRAFSTVCTRDAGRGGPVLTIKNSLTSRSIYPARYGWKDVTQESIDLCAALDAARLLTPREELDSLKALEQSVTHLSPGFVAAVASARRDAIVTAVGRLLPGSEAFDWDAILGIHRHSAEVLVSWSRAEYPHELEDEIAELRQAEADLEALRGICRLLPASTQPATVVEESGIRLEALEPIAAEVNDLVGASTKDWRKVFVGVRRLRSPVAGGAATQDLDDTRSWLDRVEAMAHAVEQSNLPRMRTLVSDGAVVLGAALRDAPLLMRWLHDGVADSPADREAVIMALALLGHLPKIEEIWPDKSDPQRTAVLVAATVLALDDDLERESALEGLDRLALGSASRRVTEDAILLTQTSNRLSVVD